MENNPVVVNYEAEQIMHNVLISIIKRSFIEELSKNTMVRQMGRTLFRELARGILGSFSGKRR